MSGKITIKEIKDLMDKLLNATRPLAEVRKERQVMTIERTRELLEEDVVGLTDFEVLFLIQQRSAFCDVLLEIIETQLLTPIGKKDHNE